MRSNSYEREGALFLVRYHSREHFNITEDIKREEKKPHSCILISEWNKVHILILKLKVLGKKKAYYFCAAYV